MTDSPQLLPRFKDLPRLPDSDERHAWQVWGPNDQLGTINLIGSEQVRYAASLVATGEVVSLSLPLNEPSPGLFAGRTAYSHIVTTTGHGRDDRVDGLFLQFSSQWDGLRHVRYRQHGFWGGRQDVDVDEGGELGVEHWARHGIIGRGVLVDAEAYFVAHGESLAPDRQRSITPGDLDRILANEHVELRAGDILLVRTGWLRWYSSLDPDDRLRLQGRIGQQPDPLECPGLDAGVATAEWLWDHRVAALASDNPTVESLPVSREAGFLHYRLLPLLGMALGEFWLLDELSAQCARTGRYEFMLSSAVLNITGGVGSPNNAYAIF